MTYTSEGREETRYTIIEVKKAGYVDLWDRVIPGIIGSSGKVKKV